MEQAQALVSYALEIRRFKTSSINLEKSQYTGNSIQETMTDYTKTIQPSMTIAKVDDGINLIFKLVPGEHATLG